jgi:hypothetical protein
MTVFSHSSYGINLILQNLMLGSVFGHIAQHSFYCLIYLVRSTLHDITSVVDRSLKVLTLDAGKLDCI